MYLINLSDTVILSSKKTKKHSSTNTKHPSTKKHAQKHAVPES